MHVSDDEVCFTCGGEGIIDDNPFGKHPSVCSACRGCGVITLADAAKKLDVQPKSAQIRESRAYHKLRKTKTTRHDQ